MLKHVLRSDCVRPDLVTLHTNMQSFFTLLWPTASNPFLVAKGFFVWHILLVAKGFFCMTHRHAILLVAKNIFLWHVSLQNPFFVCGNCKKGYNNCESSIVDFLASHSYSRVVFELLWISRRNPVLGIKKDCSLWHEKTHVFKVPFFNSSLF